MTVTAEPETRPKTSARAQLVKWLQGYLPRISEQDTTAELTKQARGLGGNSDPLIAHFIRECETEEQRAREQRHDKQQREIEQRTEQQTAKAAQAAQVTQEQLTLWWQNQLLSAIGLNDESALHPAFTVLFNALAEVSVGHDKALRREIDNAKKYTHQLVRASIKEMKVRFDEMETVFRTKRQADEKRYAEAMEQVNRLTGIEDALAELRAIADDIKRELTDTFSASSARIDELESLYGDQRKQHAEQTKLLSDRLATVELQSGDLKRELNDGDTRLGNLEDAREKDECQRSEQIKASTDKVAMFEQQVIDFAHELKEIRRDLKRATDMTQEIHQMELRLDERRIAAEENKRGPQGLPGPKGPKGDAGPAGKAGRDGRDAPAIKTKKWEIKAADFTAREVLSDGSRMPALNLRPLFEEYQRQVGE